MDRDTTFYLKTILLKVHGFLEVRLVSLLNSLATFTDTTMEIRLTESNHGISIGRV